MARGFESKDVEFQQAEAARDRTSRPPLTTDEREARTRRQTLELTLARARSELASARSDAHRLMLEDIVAHADAEPQTLN